MISRMTIWVCVLGLFVSASVSFAAKLILPQQRQAFYIDEPIEIAIAGLKSNTNADLAFIPDHDRAQTYVVSVQGDSATTTFMLPPHSLAPGAYAVELNGRKVSTLQVASGVVDSTFLISQTIPSKQLEAADANFFLGNAFNFGRFSKDRTGPLTTDLRASRAAGYQVFEQAIARNFPTIVYMYWTGYITHKPFGSLKSWGAPENTDAMRLLNFHTAQRLRRYRRNIVSVGTIDEPGLNWGRPPNGSSATGFASWDEQAWYEQRGWAFTNDPASRSDEDWMAYMAIRTSMLQEQQAQAKRDLKTVWPEMVFSTDFYAPQAVLDGTDPLHQQINDFPTSHVFVDWGIDRLGTYSTAMLEKSHDPTAKLAHAMNGQLTGDIAPQPNQSDAYRVALNGLFAAGISSNWWLNTRAMKPQDLAAINAPAKRMGALLQAFTLEDHDVAVLWSATEIAMREKAITAHTAKRHKAGEDETFKVTVSNLPENTAGTRIERPVDAYNIGGDYKESVLTAHYATSRAGYAAHIVHEHTLPSGMLNHYRVLIIVGQTFALPPDVRQAIEAFVASGGQVVIDQSTTVPFADAIVVPTRFSGLAYRWNTLFNLKPSAFKTRKEASYFKTNHFMDESVRQAVKPFGAALQFTSARQWVQTDSNELVVARHVAGDGQAIMVINGHEHLPETADRQTYWMYNYAPQQAQYRLRHLPEGAAVYTMEGRDWSQTGRLDDPHATIEGVFEPGEMKLYVVAPRPPEGLTLDAQATNTGLQLHAALHDLRMPWPLVVTIDNPAGDTAYHVYRATNAQGQYAESFPLGKNAVPGAYRVRLSSPLGPFNQQREVAYQPVPAQHRPLPARVRVFDADTIRRFLATKPQVTIAVGHASHQAAADQLAAALATQGISAMVKPEAEVLRKVAYPRIWNPYVKVYRDTGPEADLAGKNIERRLTLSTRDNGEVVAQTATGEPVKRWRKPHTLVTIGKGGYVDGIVNHETCYEPGVMLYVGQRRRIQVVKGEATEHRTTAAFRQRWAKPWTQLQSHSGAHQLPPQLPEAYTADGHLILLGDSTTSHATAVLQASDLLTQLVDDAYPGAGKSLVSFAWSPFAVEKHAIVIGASDEAGLQAGIDRLIHLAQSATRAGRH